MSLRHSLSGKSPGVGSVRSGSLFPARMAPSFFSWMSSSKGMPLVLTPILAVLFILLVGQPELRRAVKCSLPLGPVFASSCSLGHTREDLESALQVHDENGMSSALPPVCRTFGLPKSPPLKIFMYDLPEKFNLGLVKRFAANRGMKDPENATYPAHQHSGEWWLYADLMKPASKRKSPCPPTAVRVSDPSQADLFFVPVFSSLSLVVNPLSMQRSKKLGPDAYDDAQMQVELMDWLEAQEPWQKSRGRDHVIPAQDPNSMWVVWKRAKNAVLLVSDFGRPKAEESNLLKDVVMPYVHRVATYTEEEEKEAGPLNRTTLLFFMGNRYRKDGGAVRNELFKVLEAEPDMLLKEGLPTNEGRRASRHGMRTSQFCLHPAGDTPSACRMFDAIVNLCVPLVISDQIELPFEDVLDYSRFSLFVPTSDAIKPGYLGQLLRSDEVQKRLLDMQQELRRVRHLFEWETEDGVVPQVWRKLSTKVPWIREMLSRDKRLVQGDPPCTFGCTCVFTCPAGPPPKLRWKKGKKGVRLLMQKRK